MSASMMAQLKEAIQERQSKELEEEMIKKAENLDQQQDLPRDEPDEEGLGNVELETGKHKGKTFTKVYQENKEYVAWVRENVEPSKKKFTAGMLKFRLYVEARDKNKKERLSMMRTTAHKSIEKEMEKGMRRTRVESEWEEIMTDQSQGPSPAQSPIKTVPSKEDLMFQMRELQEQLQFLNQTIQTANDKKMELESQMMEMKKYMQRQG